MDPILSLSITLHSNKGCYAILLGSGVSRFAGILTGREIALDLCQKLAHLLKEDCESDPAAWYKKKFNQEPSYDDLLCKLAKLPTERNQLLRSYFEPTSEKSDSDEGLKLPTLAHKSIAKLMKQGIVKVIVTTNFDKLMEMALEGVGIVPQVILSPDAVDGALPLAHSPCTIIKVHGDYLDTRIKNAPHELEKYDDKINGLLDRVFDEYGLIICGWSAELDVALCDAIKRCKGTLFSTYWVAHGEPGVAAKSLIAHRSAVKIKSAGADEFFEDLAEKVTSLDDIELDPISAKVAVATLKRHITNKSSRIRLADLVLKETEIAHQNLFNPKFLGRQFGSDSTATREKFEFYNATLSIPLALMIHGCHWGANRHIDVWVRMLERFASAAVSVGSSLPGEFCSSVNLSVPDLRLYPATLLMYGGGIGAIIAKKYDTLARLLIKAQVRQPDGASSPVSSTCMAPGSIFSAAEKLEGKKDNHAALSNYLYDNLRQPFRELEPDDHAFVIAFGRFECLLALTIADKAAGRPPPNQSNTIQARPIALSSIPMQVCRFGCHRIHDLQVLSILKEEQNMAGQDWGPFQAGMFGGDPERFDTLLKILKDRITQYVRSACK